MGALGVRALRIYTIHPPAFYTAPASYDQAHPTAPIYLVQGVYLPNSVYLHTGNMYNPVATSTFRQELRDASAAVHGTLRRGRTPGRASGHWTADVSRWTAGWIIGVEWDPVATLATNRRNRHAPAVHGRYFYSTRHASPAERWLAARMNDMATADASYVHLGIRFARRPAGRVTIGLDTIPAVTGPPPPGSTDRRAGFALVLDPGRRTGQAWVRDQLNPDQLDYKRIPLDALPHAPGWVALELITNRPEVLPLTHVHEPMEFQDAGLLRYGDWARPSMATAARRCAG